MEPITYQFTVFSEEVAVSTISVCFRWIGDSTVIQTMKEATRENPMDALTNRSIIVTQTPVDDTGRYVAKAVQLWMEDDIIMCLAVYDNEIRKSVKL
jgi:hypothetical protein